MTQQWQVNQSQIKNPSQPIPISFSIPEGYSQTVQGGPQLIDPATVRFAIQPPLLISANCSVHLIQASFAYSQPNIVPPNTLISIPEGNNRISFKFGAAPWIDVTLDSGLYSYIDVQTALNIYMRSHDTSGAEVPPGTAIVTGASDLIQLVGVAATQQILFVLNALGLAGGVFPVGDLQISFANPSPSANPAHATDSIGPVLGWPTSGAASDFSAPAGDTEFSQLAPNVAGFSDTTAYVLYMSICKDSYLNGSSGQLLYSFPLGAFSPNSVASYSPTLQFPVPCASGSFSTVDIWTTDQSGARLNLGVVY